MKNIWGKFYKFVDKFVDGGYRKMFCWASMGTMSVALPTVYIFSPVFQKIYAPEGFLVQFNISLAVITALAGMRGAEKMLDKFITLRTGAANG